MNQARLDCYSFGINCHCFYFFYASALMFCLNMMTKGMPRIETTGPTKAEISAGIKISAERLVVLLAYP
ncbi:hypothetical protein V6N12_031529 [Hibiscus sabdariffa]|uniref:Uncharacterized protein n=1 Tax=Hibiscus sabdariffa TaxID=183260 RepID=A0ABR2CPI9_9ROSI